MLSLPATVAQLPVVPRPKAGFAVELGSVRLDPVEKVDELLPYCM